MNSINNTLYSYEYYFRFLDKLLNKKKLPSSIIFNGERGIGKRTFLLHFFTYLQLNQNEKDVYLKSFLIKSNFLFNKTLNNEIPHIRVIQNNLKSKNINIEQIRNIISFCSYASFNEKPRFILILNAENLNLNASNSLLKILENPPPNTYFFLTKSSNGIVNNTISSRCFQFNIKNTRSKNDYVFKNLLNDFDVKAPVKSEIFDKYDTPGSKINRILYLIEHNLKNVSLVDLIIYCLNDYTKTKNIVSVIYGVEFAKKFFHTKIKFNFKKNYKLYNLFIISVNHFMKFNSDLSVSVKILNKVN